MMLLHILAAKSGFVSKTGPTKTPVKFSPIFMRLRMPRCEPGETEVQCPERWQKPWDVGMGLSFLGTIMMQFSSETGCFGDKILFWVHS